MNKNKILRFITLSAVVGITVCLVAFPEKCISAASAALELCGSAVVPTLFPFFVCSTLFVSLGLAEFAAKYLGGVMRPLFKVGGAGAVAVVLGIISGYPVGAKCAADLYMLKKISRTEAESLLAFCNNSGPLFVIGTVGVALCGSVGIGIMLYVIHVLSSVMTGIIYSRFHAGNCNRAINAEAENIGDDTETSVFSAVGEAVGGAVFSILKVCGFVVFFAVVGAVIPEFNGSAFVKALLEITGGINALTELNLNSAALLPLISFFLALSGLSVLLQVGAVISNTDIKIGSYIKGKCIQAVIALVLTGGVCSVTAHTGSFVVRSGVPVFSLFEGADIGLWYAAGAVEACGWCAAIIFALCLLCRGLRHKHKRSR